MRRPISAPSMIVRPYRPEEIASLARLFTETVRSIVTTDYSEEQLAAWAPDPPDIADWRRRLSGLTTFVSESDCEIAGFVTLESNGHLDYLYVHRRFQRKGIASALCLRVEQEALSLGIWRLFTEASITARPFFERAGYRVIAPQTVERAGIPLTNYRMEKFLEIEPRPLWIADGESG